LGLGVNLGEGMEVILRVRVRPEFKRDSGWVDKK